MKIEVPYLKGAMKCVMQPNVLLNEKKWYINDHCIIKDDEGFYHFFGINNPYPEPDKQLYAWHPHISHAVSKNPYQQGFEFIGFAVDDRGGAEYVGAPYVFWRDDLGKYMMIFESFLDGKRALEFAYSESLYNFERSYQSIFTNLGHTKRDPCIIKEGDDYIVYICNPDPGGSAVSVTVTKDFTDLSDTKNCFQLSDGLNWGGCESPFVVKRNGLYYLFFTYAHHQYNETHVYVSNRFDEFKPENRVTTLYGHASEIFTVDDKEYITSCGPEDDQALNEHGLYLSELCWTDSDLTLK